MPTNEYGIQQSDAEGFGGFAVDDDDIDSMYASAVAGGSNDDDDQDSGNLLAGLSGGGRQVSEPEPAPEASAEPEPAPAPVSVPEPKPEPVKAKPTVFNTKAVPSSDIERLLERIIPTLDTYRSLNHTTQSVACQFICNDPDTDPANETLVVLNALSSDDSKRVAMEHLVNAYNESERVERLFYLLQISHNDIANLGSLVEMVSEGAEFNRNDKIRYAKELEASIDAMDSAIVDYVNATQKVLSAAAEK